ncbi:hypothetical protein ALC53_05058 [Atta colombica]|uniref:Uncharacterized protein n=1 Tax=Atta colombica TaxID=520822 RepID=A0A151I472_9HYME|nr:hypothetical protein ALC53_05058 [Atta colombica]
MNEATYLCFVCINEPVSAIFQDFRYYSQYRNLLCQKFALSLNGKDDTIFLKDSNISIVQNIIKGNHNYVVIKRFLEVENFFHTLVTSSEEIYYCSSLSDELIVINFD